MGINIQNELRWKKSFFTGKLLETQRHNFQLQDIQRHSTATMPPMLMRLPREFHVKEKLSWGDNFTIRDASGMKCYQVFGNPKKFGSQSSFQTMDGVELAALKQTKDTKLKPWKNFIWEKDGKPWAIAKQEDWGVMDKKHISIDIPGENDYKITGDRYSWNFAVYKGDVLVGQINKNWGFRDNYGVKVFDDALEVDVLLCCILIDSVYHDSDGQS